MLSLMFVAQVNSGTRTASGEQVRAALQKSPRYMHIATVFGSWAIEERTDAIESEARAEASGMMVAVIVLMLVGVALSAMIWRLQAHLLRWQQHNMVE